MRGWGQGAAVSCPASALEKPPRDSAQMGSTEGRPQTERRTRPLLRRPKASWQRHARQRECRCGPEEGPGAQARAPPFANVYHEQPLRSHRAAAATVCCAMGNTHRKTAPPAALFSAQIRPPCACTIDRLMASPIPRPPGFVVKNDSNTRPRSRSAIPFPESSTLNSTLSASGLAVRTHTQRSPASCSATASRPFMIRLTTTW